MRNTIVMLAVGILLGVYGCAAQQGGPVETGKTAGVQPGEAAKDARLD